MASPRSLDTMNTRRSPSSDHIGAQSTGPTGFETGRRPARSESSASQSRAPSGPHRSRVSKAIRFPSGDKRGAKTDSGRRPRTVLVPSTSTMARSNPDNRCAFVTAPVTSANIAHAMTVPIAQRVKHTFMVLAPCESLPHPPVDDLGNAVAVEAHSPRTEVPIIRAATVEPAIQARDAKHLDGAARCLRLNTARAAEIGRKGIGNEIRFDANPTARVRSIVAQVLPERRTDAREDIRRRFAPSDRIQFAVRESLREYRAITQKDAHEMLAHGVAGQE